MNKNRSANNSTLCEISDTEDKEKINFQREKTGYIQRIKNNIGLFNSNGGSQQMMTEFMAGKSFPTWKCVHGQRINLRKVRVKTFSSIKTNSQ